MATTIDIVTGVPAVDLEKWAQLTIEKWQYNLVQKNLIYSGDLLRSFEYTVAGEANGNTALISFAFNYYFRMLEMGVGRGRPFGSGKNRYGIFTRSLMHEVYRLSELVAEMYANAGAVTIVEGLGAQLTNRVYN